MKYVLKPALAAAALGATAGAVSAGEIKLSGNAEMGIMGSKDDSTRFHTDINATLAMSGETDGGLEFSTGIDLSEVDGATNNATGVDDEHGGIAIALSHDAFGKLTLGDTDGAFDWALAEVGMGGSLGDDHTDHWGYAGNDGLDGSHDGQIVRYENTFGGFSFGVSAELDDEMDNGGALDPVLGVGVQYDLAMAGGATLGLGAGYQAGEVGVSATEGGITVAIEGDADAVGISATLDLPSGLQAAFNYSKLDFDGDFSVTAAGVSAAGHGSETVTHVGFGVGYTFGGNTIAGNWGQMDYDVDLGALGNYEPVYDGFGVSVTHDLGGGAALQLGLGHSALGGNWNDGQNTGSFDDDDNSWSLGLTFGF